MSWERCKVAYCTTDFRALGCKWWVKSLRGWLHGGLTRLSSPKVGFTMGFISLRSQHGESILPKIGGILRKRRQEKQGRIANWTGHICVRGWNSAVNSSFVAWNSIHNARDYKATISYCGIVGETGSNGALHEGFAGDLFSLIPLQFTWTKITTLEVILPKNKWVTQLYF